MRDNWNLKNGKNRQILPNYLLEKVDKRHLFN